MEYSLFGSVQRVVARPRSAKSLRSERERHIANLVSVVWCSVYGARCKLVHSDFFSTVFWFVHSVRVFLLLLCPAFHQRFFGPSRISHTYVRVCVCDCACMWCAWLFLRRSLCAVFSLIWRIFCTQHTHKKIFFFNYFDSDACVRLCADAGLCREYFATDFQPFTETKKRNGSSKSVTFASYMHTNCWFCISEADSRPCKMHFQ